MVSVHGSKQIGRTYGITVSKVEISFFINGKKNGQLTNYQKTEIQVNNQISETNPGLLLTGDIYKMLNFRHQ